MEIEAIIYRLACVRFSDDDDDVDDELTEGGLTSQELAFVGLSSRPNTNDCMGCSVPQLFVEFYNIKLVNLCRKFRSCRLQKSVATHVAMASAIVTPTGLRACSGRR